MPESAPAAAPALPIELVLPFLERRTYLHGTTLFDAMLAFVPAGAGLSFKISHRLDTDRIRLVSNLDVAADVTPVSPASASLRWTLDGAHSIIVAYPLPASQIIARRPYPEAEVERRAGLSPQAVELVEPSPLGFVETLIPLFKLLLRHDVRCTRPGQWMFTRLDLDAVPTSVVPLRLTLSGVVPNSLARARISCAGREAGVIYFSWVAEV